MRLIAPLLFLLFFTTAHAQLHDHPVDIATLPEWMGTVVTGSKPKRPARPAGGSAKATGAPLHTNAFIGTWTVVTDRGRRIEYWGDAHRMVLREYTAALDLQNATLLDLQHNVKIVTSHWGGGQASAKVEDLHIPQAGYFHKVWNDSITATGRSKTILGHLCHELQGTSNGRDSSWYWTTTAHPQLFSDLKVWASWLTHGDLEHLQAFADHHAKAALRVRWGKHLYGTPAGGMEFIAITPGKAPMPELPNMAGAKLKEERLAWINNSGTGRLPAWMRAFITDLPPDSLPLANTPPAVDRGIPDNKFIGTLTAETPSMYVGQPDKNGVRDTTQQLAKYTYWADARRAVLIMDDPDDEGYLFYAVDLDHDVVMGSHNEGHGHVIPKVEITTLEDVGLKEFGRGIELDFMPQGKYQTILGRKCELHTADAYFLSHFYFPEKPVLNPVFDMRNWLVKSMGQRFMDLLVFGVVDKPMPMVVMGTYLTSYKPGKAKPPVVDLSKYLVRDHRLREERQRDRLYEPVEEVHFSVDALQIDEVPVDPDELQVWERNVELPATDMKPHIAVPESMVEASPDIELVAFDPTPTSTPRESAEEIIARLLKDKLDRGMNRFRGKARLQFRLIDQSDTTEWTVDYASTHERMVLIRMPLKPADAPTALLIHRKAGDETLYTLDTSSGEVTAAPPVKLRSELPPTAVNPLLGYRTGDLQVKILGGTCTRYVHDSANSHRSAWVAEAPASLFLDLFSARKGWDGVEGFIQGKRLGLGMEGMPLEAEGHDERKVGITMKVLSLEPGIVDPMVFLITKESWKR